MKHLLGNKVDEVKAWSKKERLKGGDPDLFVYRDGPQPECFFVEAKGPKDKMSANQIRLFPIISKLLCPVYMVRVEPA